MSEFKELEFVRPVQNGKRLVGTELIPESRRLAQANGKETLGIEAYDFYGRKENWHLLPTSLDAQWVIFPEAQPVDDGKLSVLFLVRYGQDWHKRSAWLSFGFGSNCVAAVS